MRARLVKPPAAEVGQLVQRRSSITRVRCAADEGFGSEAHGHLLHGLTGHGRITSDVGQSARAG
jgi:hypothetical protein